MATFELRMQGIVVRLDADWMLSASLPHGAYLTHASAAFSMHLRGWHRPGDAAWLRAELHAQNWAGPPTDLDERRIGDRVIVGGTFGYDEATRQRVREWFISDGRFAANASILIAHDTSRDSLEPFERLLDTVELEAA